MNEDRIQVRMKIVDEGLSYTEKPNIVRYHYQDPIYRRALRIVDDRHGTNKDYERNRQARRLLEDIHNISFITGQTVDVILSKLCGDY